MKTEQLASDSQASQDRTVTAVEKILPAEIRIRYLRVSFRTAVHGAPLRSPVIWSTWVLKYASKHRSRGRPGRTVLCPRPPRNQFHFGHLVRGTGLPGGPEQMASCASKSPISLLRGYVIGPSGHYGDDPCTRISSDRVHLPANASHGPVIGYGRRSSSRTTFRQPI